MARLTSSSHLHKVTGDVLPIKKGKRSGESEAPRKITEAELKFSAFHTARQARVNQKLAPGRAKRAKEREAEAKDKAK